MVCVLHTVGGEFGTGTGEDWKVHSVQEDTEVRSVLALLVQKYKY